MNVFLLIGSILLTGMYTPQQKDIKNEVFADDFSNQALIERKNDLYYEPAPDDTGLGDPNFSQDSSFLETYYRNLATNKPSNSFGICGYTGISMLLSFYDTYWNDAIIDEKYDSPVAIIGASLQNLTVASPGVQNDTMPSQNAIIQKIKPDDMTRDEFIASSDFPRAFEFGIMQEVKLLIDNDTFLGKLFSIALNNGSIKPSQTYDYYSSGNQSYLNGIGVSYNIVVNTINDYLLNNEAITNVVTLNTSKLQQETPLEKARLRNEIIALVQSGKPVLVGGSHYNDTNNNGIKDPNETASGHLVVAYCYDEVNDILYGNMGWNINQTERNIDEYFNIKIADYYSLNMNALPRQRTNNYYSSTINKFISSSGEQFSEETVINQSDYEFIDYYPTDIRTAVLYKTHLNVDHIGLRTRRFRTGFIQNQYVVLSPIRDGVKYAFIEYKFSVPVFQINVELTHWREFQVELLDKNTGKAELQVQTDAYKINAKGDWNRKLDLLSDTTNLPRNRDNPTTYTVNFNKPVYGFRFYAEVNQMISTNNNNRGRICIGKLTVHSS